MGTHRKYTLMKVPVADLAAALEITGRVLSGGK